MNRTSVDIRGLHCRSCELAVEKEIRWITGVRRVSARFQSGTAVIHHVQEVLDQAEIRRAVENAGYSLGHDSQPLFSRDRQDYVDLLFGAAVLAALYIVADQLGFFTVAMGGSSSYSSLGVVLLAGLTAGFSTCMALVGGLVLGVSAQFAAKHPTLAPLGKFRPHLLFNLGRVVSFFVLGGAIGVIGSIFHLSTTMFGILTILAGLFMLVLGLQLTRVFPRLSLVGFTLPKSFGRWIGSPGQHDAQYGARATLILGALTFFLPCGFTQAVQLYAISTGSLAMGAMTMGTFAVGTSVGLLGIGGLTAVVSGTGARLFLKSAGMVVAALALVSIANGIALTGWSPPSLALSASRQERVESTPVPVQGNVQVVRMAQLARGYEPNTFTVRKGIPVRWIVDSKTSSSCATSLVSSKLGLRRNLRLGENIIEFTPTEVGPIRFSCSMGMYRGVFNVVS